MPTIPPNLGDVEDAQLEEWHRQLVQLIASLSHINDIMANAPRLAIVQAELQIRATRRLTAATDDFREASVNATSDLHSAVVAFDIASRAAAAKLAKLTVGLVALTIALLGATIALIVATVK